MGYMRHHAIVVSSWNEERIEYAHAKAVDIFGARVTNVVPSPMNGHRSFLVATDGSNEGWDESDIGDAQRDRFVKWLRRQEYEDGSTSLAWVEVQYADDEKETKIVRDSDDTRRAKYPSEATR